MFIRNFFCLLLSLLFHFLLFIFLFADISILPVQSAPQGHVRIVADVMLISRPAETPEESKKDIVPAASAKSVQKAGPQKNTAPKQAAPVNPVKEAVLPKNTAENRTQGKQEMYAGKNETDTSGQKEIGLLPSAPETPSLKPGSAAELLQPQGTPSIAAVDSVVVVNRVRPVYPQISRRRGEEGNVILLVDVKDGKVMNVTIEKSSGIKALDSSAASAAGKWRFSSDTNITVRIPVSFKLKD